MSDLAGGALTGRSFTLMRPLPAGTDLRDLAEELANKEPLSVSLSKGETMRVLPCSGVPPWMSPHAGADPTPLSWRDDRTGVLRFFLRLETRSVPRATLQADAERLGQARLRRSLVDLPPKAREALLSEAKITALGRVEPKVAIHEGYVIGETLWMGHPRAHEHPQVHAALRALFGVLHLAPGVILSAEGGWDAVALSVLIAASRAPGGHLGEGVHVRSAALQDANVRVDTASSGLPLSGLLAELLARRPLPKVHKLGFDVLWEGVLREVDVDVDGVVRVMPAPSGAGLWPDRIRRRHQEAASLVGWVNRAMSIARGKIK